MIVITTIAQPQLPMIPYSHLSSQNSGAAMTVKIP